MLERIIPSQIFGTLVPKFARARWGKPIDAGFEIADTIMAGKDEKANSLRTALVAFSIRIISAFIAYISQVLIARWLGSHEYGIFVWVWVAAVIAGGLSCLGFPSAVVKFIPQYRVDKDNPSLRGIVFGSRLYAVMAATIIAVIGIASTYFFEEAVGNAYVMPLFLGAICLPMLALAEVQDGVARAFSWIDIALSPTYLIRPVIILVAMALALAIGQPATASTALIASIAATWVTSVGQMLVMNHRLKKQIPAGPRNMQPKIWIAVALPILLVEGFFTLLTNVDILIAGAYLKPKEVAVYFAAVKTLALVHFVYFAVKAGAAHRYSQYFTSGDTPRFESFVHDTVRWTFWPSLAMGVLLLITGKFLLSLFGQDFASGYPLLFILVVGIIARAAIGPAESVLNMAGQQKICAAVYGVTLLVNVMLNLTFIPIYGLYGAAWATTIAMIFEAGALYSITKRRLGIRMFVFARSSKFPSEQRGQK
ncbi:MAG: lipopolysaccharide biosynthesis protein [Rhizobiaceae bacterium]